MTRRADPTRRAFSLLELTLSTAIMSILLLTLGSSVMLGARAVPSGLEPIADELAISRFVSRIRADLEYATLVTIGSDSDSPQGVVSDLLDGLGLDIDIDIGGPPGGVPGNQGGGGVITIELVVPDRSGDGLPETIRYDIDTDAETITRTHATRDDDDGVWSLETTKLESLGDTDDPLGLRIGLAVPGTDRVHEVHARYLNDPEVRIQ